MAQLIKLPPVTLASNIVALTWVPPAPLLFQLPAKTLAKAAKDGPNTWVPATLMGDPDRVPGFWLHLGPGLAFVAIYRVKQWVEEALSLIVSQINHIKIISFYKGWLIATVVAIFLFFLKVIHLNKKGGCHFCTLWNKYNQKVWKILVFFSILKNDVLIWALHSKQTLVVNLENIQ